MNLSFDDPVHLINNVRNNFIVLHSSTQPLNLIADSFSSIFIISCRTSTSLALAGQNKTLISLPHFDLIPIGKY